jgi:4-carboxymuconolactone decarboxylase
MTSPFRHNKKQRKGYRRQAKAESLKPRATLLSLAFGGGTDMNALLAIIVVAFSLLASGSALAQAGSPAASDVSGPVSQQDAQTIRITRGGSQSSVKGVAEHFTGSVRVDPLFREDTSLHMGAASVTFEPGARTAWHIHPLGQTLIVTAGKGWVQQWGGPIEEIRERDVVHIPPNVKHWHGATATTSVTHIAIQESLNGKTVEWMEKVSDEQYGTSPSASGEITSGTREAAVAQRMFGDFDPKLAEITDNVLFADVWERPGLTRHDRSLITVAALIAMNRSEQLRSHLQRARANGVTKEEVIEVITQLAFYTGWPNAVSAIAVAKETFK